MARRRGVLAGYAAWMTLLTVAYYGLPGLRVATWALIAASGTAAIVAGVIVNRPARVTPWLLLAAASLSFAAGQLTFLLVRHQSPAFHSLADVCYLAVTYPICAAALLIFIQRRSAGYDRRSLLDALTLTVGVGLLSWVFLILPYVHDGGLAWWQKAAGIAYPLGGVLVLAMLARLLTPGTWRARSPQLLTVGTLGMLVYDVFFGLTQLSSSFRLGSVNDLGWAVCYVAWGAAALHPSMTELTQPLPQRAARNSRMRVALLMAASLIAPAVLLAESVGRSVRDAGVIAVCSAVLYVLVLSRLADVAAAHRRALDRASVLSREVVRRDSEAYFRTLVQDASDVILIIDDDGRIRYATPSAGGIFGSVPVEGRFLWDLMGGDEQDEIARALAALRAGASPEVDGDWRITSRAGGYVEVEVRCSDLRHEPTVGGLVLTLRDVTEQRQLERELNYRACHDSLTGLANRVLFQERVVEALARARRAGRRVAVLLADLDDFKVINDAMGHTVGDELLVAAGSRLSSRCGPTGTVARLGGDEFALLIEDVPAGHAVEELAESIVAAFTEPFTLGPGAAVATATVGFATTDDSASPADLVRHADLALYAAKAAGKRQWRRYQPVLSTGMIKRRELQLALDHAVSSRAFSLVYQPIVELVSGEVVGFEALARWPHPDWGMIHPEQFIALAEETGHIVPLGSWVLRQATMDMAGWRRRAGGPPPYVSVNVSARQLRDPSFVGTVRRILAETRLAPSALLLELTESALLRPDERIRADLAELKSIGVRLAIDDFGTGYSSLSYLRELPIDVLKMDKSFVDGIAVSAQRLALAEVITRIATTLRLTVVAEGIESEVQRDLLVSMGCPFGQGYLLARPLGGPEAEALVRAGPALVPGPARPAEPAPEGDHARG